MEKTTIWSFPDRGEWATHSGKYRGNWSPYVPRNLLLKYSKEGDWVLDQFVGSGTSLVEAKLLNRNAIGVDINTNALLLSENNLKFESDSKSRIVLKEGTAENLDFIKDNSIDMICTHPPYADIIKYSSGILGDISLLKYDDFLASMNKVASEANRVLKKNRICAFMIGDIREHGYVRPLGMDAMQIFIDNGFKLKEIIIKEQHNCRSTAYWERKKRSFYLLAHEYIFVLEKISER
ncbi:DNA methylase [Butyrivibrio hungatei]|uniref:Methyltransferase n=1 Tax=Butyrivibrio hungatei TaxID=185008 RepID=A0A1G5EA38_9FIRM|nr:DNA methyltransferase [Butyrivibrio hungatei]SCY23873.1 DNA methylase [Butyrivibrio hungatei]